LKNELMSEKGRTRRFRDVRVTAALPPITDIRLMGRHGRNGLSIPDTPTATPSGEGPRSSQRSLPTRHDRQECLCSLRRSQCFTRVKSGSITSYDFL